MALTVDKALREARAALRAGQGAQARRMLLELYDRFPANARILSELAAVQSAVTGLPARPFGPDQMRRTLSLRAAQGIGPAVEEAVAAVHLNPSAPAARNLLGGLYLEAGVPAAALAHLRAAVKADPAFREAGVNLGVALLRTGSPQAAADRLRIVLDRHPGFAPALDALADAELANGRPAEAALALRALAGRPGRAPEVVLRLAHALAEAGDDAAAMAELQALSAERPADARVWTNLGNLRLSAGQIGAAAEDFRRAITADPRGGAGYYNLGRAVDFAPDDPALAAMRALADDPALPAEEKVPLLFALSKAHEDAGEVDESFRRLSQGNALRRAGIDYTLERDRMLLDALARRFGPGAPAPDPASLAPAAVRPVFIVGMMRSGTTLAEQILSSHSAVTGAGELDTLGAALAREVEVAGGAPDAPLSVEALLRIRNRYLTDIAGRAQGRPVVVDKMPANFRLVGLIRLALPEARILHMRRDPVAVCWSIYKTLFTNTQHGYAWDLAEVAGYHDLYEAFMARLAVDNPGAVMDVDYRALTETPEPVIRAMLDHCGLPFEAACLAPQDNDRRVQTASLRQVRRGIYTGSTDRWKGFGAHLAPLVTHFANRAAGGAQGGAQAGKALGTLGPLG